MLLHFAKTITHYWRRHNKKQIAGEAINYLVFLAHMEILILCIHEDMIGMFSTKLIFSPWNGWVFLVSLLFLAFWPNSHKYQCLSKLAQVGLPHDITYWGDCIPEQLIMILRAISTDWLTHQRRSMPSTEW